MARTAVRTVDQYTAAAQQGDPQAIASLLGEVFQPYSVTPKVGLRKQDNLLYIALESASAADSKTLLPVLKQALSRLALPWLKAAEVSGRLPGQTGPVWRQELLFQTQSLVASALTAPVAQAQAVQVNVGGDLSGQLIVGDNNLQTVYRYTYNVEHGGILNVAAAPQVTPRATPINLRPQPFPNLLDRKTILLTIRQALKSAQSVELYGGEGFGKTVLLRHLLYDAQATTAFSDGVVYTSGHRQQAEDLLWALHDAFYESSVPCRPSYTQVQHALQDKHALIVLDDLSLEKADLDWLMAAVPYATFVLVSPERRYWLDGVAAPLAWLPLEESLCLVEQALGRRLTPADRSAAQTLWQTVAGNPLQLRRAAAQVKHSQHSLAMLATPAVASQWTLFQTIVGALSRSHQQLLALLGAMGGVALTPDQVRSISNLPNAKVLLSELQALHLVDRAEGAPNPDDDGQIGYQLCADLLDFCQQAWPPEPWLGSAVDYFIQQVPPLPEHVDALEYLADWSAQTGHWQDCLTLSRILEGPLSLKGDWGQWQAVLEQSLQAARHTGSSSDEAWALHQLGTRALCDGDATAAETALTQALRLREILGDQAGAAVTRHNLGLLVPPLVPPEPTPIALPTSDPDPASGWLSLKLALMAMGGLALLAGGIATMVLVSPGTPPAVDLSAEILEFGERELNTPSDPQILTLINTGARPVVIDRMVLMGDRDFIIHREDCTLEPTLDPADSCEIAIIFEPSVAGDRDATLQLSADRKVYDIQLTGSGSETPEPGVSFAPSSVNFKELRVGNAGTASVTLTNDGTAPLTIQTLAISGKQGDDFAIATSDCAEVTLAPADSCNLELQFKPTGTGERRAVLTVKSNAADEASLPISGIGTQQQRPIAADDSVTALVNTPVRVTVLANDRDPAGGTLTLASVTSGRTGQVKVNDDNTITYTPGSEATRDSFTYTVRNELGETAKATVNVTVETATTESPDPPSEPPNRPPVANTDQAQTDPGKSVTIRVLANDSDPDQGDQISIASVDGNTQAGGSVGDNGDGTLTYSPPPEFAGADRFTYTVRDRDGATATATVEVTINAPTPLPPPVANDDRAETAAGQTVTIQVLANDQGDDLEIAALDNSGRLGGGVGNNGDGTVNYTPPFDFSGVDTFRYSIRDRNGTQSEAATVSVLVEAVNNPPVANNDSTRHEYSGSPRAARLNVLANDSDPDGGTADLAIESVTQGQYTQVEISADRQAVIYTLTLPSVQASPNGVTDSFTYTIRDPNGAVSAPATVTVVGYHGPDSNPALTLPLATPSSP